MRAWWSSFGTGSLQVITADSTTSSAPDAIIALARRGKVLRSPTNWHTPCYGPVSRGVSGAEEVFRTALLLRPRRLDLSFLCEPHAALVSAVAESEGYRILSRELLRSPYISVEGDWASYRAGLPKGLRSEVQRRWRRLREAGTVNVQVTTGSEDLAPLLAEGFAVEAAGWKGRRGSAIASDPRTEGFYRSVADWAASEGILRLGFLRLDGRAIAFDFCLEANRIHYLLKTGYDAAYSFFGPGKLLREVMIARALEIGMLRYEFLGDAMPWKREWTEAVRALTRVQVIRRDAAGSLDHLIYACGRPRFKRAVRAPIR